jgi:hypothetical protein
MDFHEICYGDYAIGTRIISFMRFLCCSISKEHRMGPSLSVCLSVHQWSYEPRVVPGNNLRMADQIFMKFGMVIMPLEASPLWKELHNELPFTGAIRIQK